MPIGLFYKVRLEFDREETLACCVSWFLLPGYAEYADVAELADALDSGSSVSNDLEVQLLSSALHEPPVATTRCSRGLFLRPIAEIRRFGLIRRQSLCRPFGHVCPTGCAERR